MTPVNGRWEVRASRPVRYDVVKAPGLFAPESTQLLGHGQRPGGRRFVVVDANVAKHHGPRIRNWFVAHGIEARLVVFPGGEEHKTIEVWQGLLRELDAFPIHRRDEPIIAIGGGVLTDVVAWVAASFRRGVPHIKVPTTLMGYVDAAVGVKAGINFNGHKNRLGSFEPPLAVYLDKDFLPTLPRRHLLNGVGEIVKLAVIADRELFERLERDGAPAIANCFASAAGDVILDRAIGGMLAELAPNLFEDDLARRVDFGHTFSYGLEANHEHRLLHGEAVLLDVLVSTVIARNRGLLPAAEAERVFALVDRLGMRLDLEVLDASLMWQSLADRVLHRNGRQRVPMPAGIGECIFVDDILWDELASALPVLHARFQVNHEHAAER